MTLYQGGYDVDRASRVAANTALDEACGRGGDGADDPAGAMPLTPDQIAELHGLAVEPRLRVVVVERPVLAALLAAYRREVRQHLNNAYRYLHQAGDLRLGANRSDWLGRAAEHLEAAGYSGLAAGVRDDYADFRDVMDALREALRIGEGEK